MVAGDWLLAMGLVAIAGFTRGFSGFGAGLILAPSLSLLFPPQQVIAAVLLLEMTAAGGLIPEAVHQTKWSEVVILALSAAVMIPVGTYFLSILEPTLMRRVIGALILGFVALLTTGNRYFPKSQISVTSGIGALSGFLTGLAGIGGPPIVLYQMAGENTAAINRTNFISFFALTQFVALISYWLSGLLSKEALLLFAHFAPIFLLGLFLGGFCFKRVNESLFRKFVFGLLLIAAVLALIL